jgi:hypothetical protein
VALESAHTKLHLYDLCACLLHDHCHDQPGHAALISRTFAHNVTIAPPPTPAATSQPSSASASPAAEAKKEEEEEEEENVTSIPWGHALNSCSALRARWDAVAPRGLFVEADLRIRPSSLSKRASALASGAASGSSSTTAAAAVAEPFGIDDVCMAHDAGVEGDGFLDWWATLESLVALPSSAPATTTASDDPPTRRPLGLKLDFKSLDAVAPVLAFLRSLVDGAPAAASSSDASSSSSSSSFSLSRLLLETSPELLWLNADVLNGPGVVPRGLGSGFQAPTIDGPEFLRICTEAFPRAVLSLGWVTKSPAPLPPLPSAAGVVDDDASYYSHSDVSSMLALISRYPSAHQVTFPLRAAMVRSSWTRGSIQCLLSSCPRASLTVWTSRVDQSQPHALEDEQWIRDNLPRGRTFIDLILD